MAIGFNNPSLSVSFAMNDTAALKGRVMDYTPAEPGLSTPDVGYTNDLTNG